MSGLVYTLDTEFWERGHEHPVQLISIGVVCSDGRTYYAQNTLIDTKQIARESPWLRDNVLTQLDNESWRSRQDIAKDLKEFIVDSDHKKPSFWGYFADYDWVLFNQLFGRMIDAPAYWPKICFDLKQWMMHLGVSKHSLPRQTAGHHNALDDAKWDLEVYNYLKDLEGLK